ncbi:hypothetical protein M3_0162 [Lysinibacillus phage vB_LfM_LysYB1]|nr:hypothetical protein M3_0162 [Lysinibacillus phage vB_LfM_LysYB1]WAB25327.1 hypothetical protein M5_0149 [Lysinibacillus phage vB_LfM_LysYB2]
MKRKFFVTVTSPHDTPSVSYYVLFDGTEAEVLQRAYNGYSLDSAGGGKLVINGKSALTITVKEES